MKGQIKIRKGNENQEPIVVYVTGWNKGFELWVSHKINSGEILLSKDEDLMDFDYNKFKVMYYEWKIQNSDKVKQNFVNLLEEIKTQL